MKLTLKTLAVALAVGAFATPAVAMDDHKILKPSDVKWSPAPASLPKGAEVAVLYGDPSKDGLFAMRIKMPKGYRIPPHTHPRPEVVTVVSGEVRLGTGESASTEAQPIPSGGFFALPPDMVHSVTMDEDTVVQLNSNGPWAIKYVNPADDPRSKSSQ